MGIVKSDEFRGAHFDEWLVCHDCMTDEDWAALQEDQVVTDSEIEKTDDMYFCDRCKKRL